MIKQLKTFVAYGSDVTIAERGNPTCAVDGNTVSLGKYKQATNTGGTRWEATFTVADIILHAGKTIVDYNGSYINGRASAWDLPNDGVTAIERGFDVKTALLVLSSGTYHVALDALPVIDQGTNSSWTAGFDVSVS